MRPPRRVVTTAADLYTKKFGPRFLLDTFQGTAAAGQEVILFQASNSDPAEDWVIGLGTVGSFYRHHRHLIKPGFDQAYGRLNAYEFQYEPLGVNSGFCASTWPGVVAQPGYKVRLETCGQYSNSIWAAGATRNYGSTRPMSWRTCRTTSTTSTVRRTASPTRSC